MGLETLSRSGLRLLQPMLQDDVQNRVLDISLSSSDLGYDKLTDIGANTQCCVLFTTVDDQSCIALRTVPANLRLLAGTVINARQLWSELMAFAGRLVKLELESVLDNSFVA